MTNTETANALAASGQHLEAYDRWPDIIHSGSLSRKAYINLARALWKQRRYTEAEQALEVVMAKAPDFTPAQDLYDRIRAARSATFKVDYKPLSDLIFRVDSLRGLSLKRDQMTSVQVRGWVEVTEEGCELVVEEGSSPARVEALSIPRSDAAKFLSRKGVVTPLPLCGFSFRMNLSERSRISLRSPNGTIPIMEIYSRRVTQVLEGKDGWLFLNNDTNRSADLFTGALPATKQDADEWVKFALKAEAKLTELGIASCMVIAPSKEDVFPEFHPLKPANTSLLDLVVHSILKFRVRISCPVHILRQYSDTYYKTDTHWSDVGAWICAQDILSLLKIPTDRILPTFREEQVIGDLGSKLNPVRRCVRKIWVPFSPPHEIVFDNNIIGSGGIKVYRNDGAIVKKKMLIFGDSFSKHLSRIFADIFSEITYINCPTTMPIMDVAKNLKPDIVLFQTNARYLKLRPMISEFSSNSVLSKLKQENLPSWW